MKQAEQAGKDAGPQVQKQLLESMGMGSEAENLFGDGGLAGLLKELSKPRTLSSAALAEEARKLIDATSAFNDSLAKLENSAGPAWLKTMEGVVDKAKVLVDYLNSREFTKEEQEHRKAVAEDAQKSGKPNPFATGDLRLQKQEDTGLLPWLKNKLGLGDAPHVDPSMPLPKYFHRSSYEGSDTRSLLRNASYISDGDRTAGFRAMLQNASDRGHRLRHDGRCRFGRCSRRCASSLPRNGSRAGLEEPHRCGRR